MVTLNLTLNEVEYYTGDDPYHYTIDNRPLQNLASNDAILVTAIQTLAAATQPLAATSPTIGGSALAAGAVASTTVAVAGAANTMAVVVTPVTYPGNGFTWHGYVSAAGVVTVMVTAIVAGTPVASAYNVRVIP
jgi:hypothetical protein